MSKTTDTQKLRKYSLSSLQQTINRADLAHFKLNGLKHLKKEELIRLIISYNSNQTLNSRKLVELQLENNFLNRKVLLLEQQIRFLTPDGKRNFRDLKKYKNKAMELQKERLDGD